MTKETIIENCKRLFSFYKITADTMSWMDKTNKEMTTMDLLKWYSRCLDVNGSPSNGLSLLLLEEIDYNEAKEYCKKSFHSTYRERKVYFNFQYDGYNWEIRNITKNK